MREVKAGKKPRRKSFADGRWACPECGRVIEFEETDDDENLIQQRDDSGPLASPRLLLHCATCEEPRWYVRPEKLAEAEAVSLAEVDRARLTSAVTGEGAEPAVGLGDSILTGR